MGEDHPALLALLARDALAQYQTDAYRYAQILNQLILEDGAPDPALVGKAREQVTALGVLLGDLREVTAVTPATSAVAIELADLKGELHTVLAQLRAALTAFEALIRLG